MRLHWVIAILLALSGTAWAQTQEELIRRRDRKLAEAWVRDRGFITDYDAARQEARKSGRLIFAYFTVTTFV